MMQLLLVRDRYHGCSSPDATKYLDDLTSDSVEKLLLSLTRCMEKEIIYYEGDDLIFVDEERWSLNDVFLMDDLKMDILRLSAKVWAAKVCASNKTQVWKNINNGMLYMSCKTTMDQFRYLKDFSPEVACYLYQVLSTRPRKAYATMHTALPQLWADVYWEDGMREA